MLTKLKKSNLSEAKGFTIIEVLIVLAIAGLILLIVFLAVPALQRNARNTQRKTDIGRIGSAATTIVANNNGTVSSTTLSTFNLTAEVGSKLSYYQTSGITAGDSGTAPDLVAVINKDNVRVVGNAKCGATAGADAVVQARQIAVLYAIENGGGTGTSVCVDQ